eukprot:47919-Chlamydomonas_euryale.AAC.1
MHMILRRSSKFDKLFDGQTACSGRPGGSSKEGSSRSLLAAMSSDGRLYVQNESKSVNRTRFREFIKNLPFPKESVLLMDNCSIHHGNIDLFESLGYVPLFLPPYSPDLQPIELCFSKLKHTQGCPYAR